MVINYNEIYKQAKMLKISPHLLIKRKINYRKAKKREPDCRFCLHLRFLEYYKNGLQRKQCYIIGESCCESADVDHLHICNEYQKIENNQNHDYKKFIKLLEKKE
jgi:hypothetical protein